jgi:hypothetical protein
MAADNFVNDEDVKVRNRQKKRSIEDDIDEVSDEVTITAKAKKYKYQDTAFFQLIDSFFKESVDTSVRLPKVIRNRAIELIHIAMPMHTKSQAENLLYKCTDKCRGSINIKTGEKTKRHPSVRKIDSLKYNKKNNPRHNPKNNPRNNLKRQLKVAADNYLELMEMFLKGLIPEMPLSDAQIEAVVDGLFLTNGKLNDDSISIYTGYTGVSLDDEPYRYYI